MALQFKFVELSIVTDESLEETVNEWVGKGWHLEGIRFVMSEHSRRPAMAFVSFTRDAPPEVADREPPRRPPPLVKPEPTSDEDEGEPAVLVAEDGTDVE